MRPPLGSWTRRALRSTPTESNDPARASDSTPFLFSTDVGTRRAKSWKELKPSLREDTMHSATASPTLRMAERPNRIWSPLGVKSSCDELTSGGSTLICSAMHSARYARIRSVLALTEVSRAAMYSTWQRALSQAVWYATR